MQRMAIDLTVLLFLQKKLLHFREVYENGKKNNSSLASKKLIEETNKRNLKG